MSKESKALAKEAWTSQRVLDLIRTNALISIMVIALTYTASKNPNFINPASPIHVLA